ncbi:MAG: hypothetical protein MK329_04255 [Pirellulales bacterium]|nr:hypothetical protein [Pirellulales bacterium]
MLYFPCPNCNEQITAPDSQAGTEQLCNKCEQPIIVPGDSSVSHATSSPVSSAFDDIDFASLTDTPVHTSLRSPEATAPELAAAPPAPGATAPELPKPPQPAETVPTLEPETANNDAAVVPPVDSPSASDNTVAPSAKVSRPDSAPNVIETDDDLIPLLPVEASPSTTDTQPPEPIGQANLASEEDDLQEDGSADELELMPAIERDLPNVMDQYVEIQEFSVKCGVCETVIMVSTDQIGSSTRCPDCFTDVPITTPVDKPLTRLKPIDGDDDMFGLEPPVEQTFEPLPGVTPISRSVEEHQMELLAKAQTQYQKETEEYELDDNEQWIVRLAQILVNGGFLAFSAITTMVLWLGLCVLYYRTEQAGSELQFAQVFCTIIGILILVPGLLLLASTFIVICRETAAGDLELIDWPPIDLMEWLSNLFFVAVAALFSYIPALPFALLFIFTIDDPGSYWWIVPTVIHLITFSFVVMSMMSSGSMTRPISGELIKAIANRPGELSRFLAYAFPFSILMFVFSYMAIDHEFAKEYKVWTYFFGCLLFTMTSFLFARNLGLMAFYVAKPEDYVAFNPDKSEQDTPSSTEESSD